MEHGYKEKDKIKSFRKQITQTLFEVFASNVVLVTSSSLLNIASFTTEKKINIPKIETAYKKNCRVFLKNRLENTNLSARIF